ncbi:unnamed protein product [Clonostachys rosea]|uniref:Uncharacterized protein n=1 Tax=Bionectria ochroleuca TaxID=29856 RepID=A0ABY6UZY6_BIOOC|nr:unnamed protein product [Clonostachys rosea]
MEGSRELFPYLALGTGILLVLWTIVRSVYLVFFHPLSKIPGPPLYALSDLPYLYHLAQGTWPHVLKELHQKYGPSIRYTPADVSFTTPDAWKTIYDHKTSAAKSFIKDPRFYVKGIHSEDPHIINANREDHKRMRRLISHAFSEKALRGQETVMSQYIDLFITKMSEYAQSGQKLDIVKWYNFTTFDLIGDLSFGQPFGCLESGGYHPWVSMIFDDVRFSALAPIVKRHPILKPLTRLFVPRGLMEKSKEHFKLTQETTLNRVASGNIEREDFMSYILRHNDEKGLSKGEMVENAGILIIAGSETTATLLSGTTFHLLKNPETYAKLVKEIRSAFESEEEITLLRVNELPYLIATFNEGFRAYPPVPIGTPRITPAGGEFIDGYWIPQGTSVSVSQMSSYHSDRNFRDPQQFVPERWLPNGDPKYKSDAKSVLNPFSIGPRNCIGKNLAYAEMRLILARLLWRFDLELMPESREWDQQKIWSLWSKGELNVKLTEVAR